MRNLNIVCQLAPIFLAAVFACNTVSAKPNAKPNAAARARASSPLPESVRKALKSAAIPPTAIGIYVQEVDGKRALLKNQESRAFLPASTIKLVTTDAALNLLGPSYTWKTRVLGQGQQIGETWHGDLIIKGSFDPKLVQENLWLLLRQLRAKGIRQINGNIVLDRSIMPISEQDAGKFDGDPIKAYNVVPDPLLLNFKTVRLYFRPDGKNNAQVTMDPVLPHITLAPLRAQDGRCDDWHEQLGIEFVDKRINFSGTYPANCGEKTWDVHPYSLSPDAYFAAVLGSMWRELGGAISGTISSVGNAASTAQEPTLLVEWQSPSLAEVVRDINKYSNNVMARQLLLTLGIDRTGNEAASTTRGIQRVTEWLAEQKIEAPELVLENGSGLSRNEKIAPQSMARLLIAAYHSPVMPELMASLPIVGYDGTMRSRLKQSEVAGRAHIKTGTLNDVRAIAGYVLTASGKRYVVVAFINHGKAMEGKAALDALLEWVYQEG